MLCKNFRVEFEGEKWVAGNILDVWGTVFLFPASYSNSIKTRTRTHMPIDTLTDRLDVSF